MVERTGGQILVDQLKIHRVEVAFCVPGESYLPLLDALFDVPELIRLITCRHEGGAAFAAEAYGKLTGQPGICLVSRGPGATNAGIGVHTAAQDSTPLILFVGQVPRNHTGRDAFQEIDYQAMYGHIAKWAGQIDDPRRIPEYVSRAFHLATSGRPGPVVLALPEDMLAERAAVADAAPYRRAKAYPLPEMMQAMLAMLADAERPLMMVGLGGWTPAAAQDIRDFALTNNLPTLAAFRSQDLVDNRSGYYLGAMGVGANPALKQRIEACDVLLAVGARPDDRTCDAYRLLTVPRPRQKLIHVYPDPAELGRVYQADLPINASLPEFAAAAKALPAVDGAKWAAWAEAGRGEYLEFIKPVPGPAALNLGEIMVYLRQRLPAEAILTNGAGSYTAFCHRFYQFSLPRTQLAPISGAMGYGVPAAIAAKVVQPERIVVALAGDGCFLMSGQELATAVQYGLNIIFVVVNNGMLGSIRMHQERRYPGRVIGTTLVNPDFAAYAAAFGAYGEVVEKTEDFPAAFERALTAGSPALLELRVDPQPLIHQHAPGHGHI